MKHIKHMISILLMAIFLGNVFFPMPTYATNSKKTQEEIEQAIKDKETLEGQLDKTQDQIEDWKDEHDNLKSELGQLNKKLLEVSERLTELEQQIDEKIIQIAETQAALSQAQEKEAWQYECMVIRVRDMYERKTENYLTAILNAVSFSDMLNVADRFEKIADYDQKKLDEFKENRRLIEDTEARLLVEKTELLSLQDEAEVEKAKVAEMIAYTAKTISKYADQITDAEEKAKAYEAEIKKKEEDLEYLKKKLAEEMKLSQSAANSTWRDISEVKFAESDRYLLANLIYCEAGGEPYAGQLAVGSVVINRVLSSVYPNTIVGVIYQRKQFSPVGSGRLDLALSLSKATARCYQAADEAMSGVTNVGGCVYFRTPIEGLTGINIGGHVFY